jgi:hypothetical protein
VSRKVFILNDGGHDYSASSKFGDPIICSEGAINKDDISQMYRVLSDALFDAQEKDYILVTSLTSLCMVASAIMANRFGQVHLLIYRDGRYEARDLILEQL